jgi:hypothetical protein
MAGLMYYFDLDSYWQEVWLPALFISLPEALVKNYPALAQNI